MANAYLLSTYFHEKYRSLIQPSVISKITQKEHDIIAWAAEGKTDEEIAVILNLSAHTVRWHWKKIFTKLDARGRLYAITKAISMGLVTPARITPPP
jgi:DNA-binding CsgD family transcriptional regulator